MCTVINSFLLWYCIIYNTGGHLLNCIVSRVHNHIQYKGRFHMTEVEKLFAKFRRFYIKHQRKKTLFFLK